MASVVVVVVVVIVVVVVGGGVVVVFAKHQTFPAWCVIVVGRVMLLNDIWNQLRDVHRLKKYFRF